MASFDVEAFSRNLARVIEEGGKALAAYLKPREEGKLKDDLAQELTEIVSTLGKVAEYWLSDPQRALELQSRLGAAYLELWGNAAKRLTGEAVAAGGRAGAARQALCRSGMDVEPVLRLPQAGLSAHQHSGPTGW